MGELGVLVAVAVSGFVAAWVSRLIAGTLVTPLLYLDASSVPSMTHHWWIVTLTGALLQAVLAAVILMLLLPSLSGRWIGFEPAFGSMLVGNLIGGSLLLWFASARLSGNAGVAPAVWVIAVSCALLGLAVVSVLVMWGSRLTARPRAAVYPPGAFAELRRRG